VSIDRNKYIHHLDKVCSEYSMTGSDIYNILLSKKDEDFPLSFETIKYQVLKDVSVETLKTIFTLVELKSIFAHTNIKKIKNKQTRKFITHL